MSVFCVIFYSVSKSYREINISSSNDLKAGVIIFYALNLFNHTIIYS